MPLAANPANVRSAIRMNVTIRALRFAIPFAMLAAGPLSAAEITVFAAASMTDALREIAASHEKASGDKVRFNFAASNTLAQQIRAGAPADIFFSADEAKMDALAAAGLIATDTRRSLLGNSLVIVTPLDGIAIARAADLAKPAVKRLSLGDPRAVPAGIYAKAWLEKAGLWAAVEAKVVPAESVRTALAVVESGDAEAGIVYKTDAAISRKVKVALAIPAAEGPEIRYPVAMVADSRNPAAARRFLVRLAAEEALAVFRKHGFVTTGP